MNFKLQFRKTAIFIHIEQPPTISFPKMENKEGGCLDPQARGPKLKQNSDFCKMAQIKNGREGLENRRERSRKKISQLVFFVSVEREASAEYRKRVVRCHGNWGNVRRSRSWSIDGAYMSRGRGNRFFFLLLFLILSLPFFLLF